MTKYKQDLADWCVSATANARDDVTPVLAAARRKLFELYEQLDEAYHDLCAMISEPKSKLLDKFDELIGQLDECQVDCKCLADDIDEYITGQEGYEYDEF